jgi:hypothetical protein
MNLGMRRCAGAADGAEAAGRIEAGSAEPSLLREDRSPKGQLQQNVIGLIPAAPRRSGAYCARLSI